MFAPEAISDVPIERLLTNLQYAENQCKDDRCKADIEYRIARLNAMRYARRTRTVGVAASDANSKTVLEPKLRGYEHSRWPNYRQYELSKTPLLDLHTSLLAQAENLISFVEPDKTALSEAIAHYRQSLKFEPKNAVALLGLGWSLKEHGDTEEARDILRKAFAAAHNKVAEAVDRAAVDRETFPRSIDEDTLAQETALYLIPLLDPKKDVKEIETLSAGGKPDYEPHYVTPIVVPTTPNTPFKGCKESG
jgi:tetratricopeptide (TPR) repeat protein